MDIEKKKLKHVNVSSEIVVDVTPIDVRSLYNGEHKVGIAKVDGKILYAPEIKSDSEEFEKPNYALKIDESGYAYVTVPIEDKFVTSAWYDPSTKQILLSVGSDIVSVNVGDMIHEYKPDNKTIGLSGDNEFYVKDRVFAKDMND